MAHLANGDPDKAISAFEEAVKLSPEDTWAKQQIEELKSDKSDAVKHRSISAEPLCGWFDYGHAFGWWFEVTAIEGQQDGSSRLASALANDGVIRTTST
jgi:hypothetical protein